MHILVSIACDFDFVVDRNDGRLVLQRGEPLLGESCVPRCVGTGWVRGRKGVRSIGEDTVTGISVIRVECLLIYEKSDR